MTWFDYVLIGLWLFALLVNAAQGDKPRRQAKPAVSRVVGVVMPLLLIFGLLWTRGLL
jgi:hypothetical protein